MEDANFRQFQQMFQYIVHNHPKHTRLVKEKKGVEGKEEVSHYQVLLSQEFEFTTLFKMAQYSRPFAFSVQSLNALKRRHQTAS